jgi:hypothetical protein
VWCDHREVQPIVESVGNEDRDQMDGMLADISREYDLDSEEHPPPLEVQKFYMLLVPLMAKCTRAPM